MCCTQKYLWSVDLTAIHQSATGYILLSNTTYFIYPNLLYYLDTLLFFSISSNYSLDISYLSQFDELKENG